MPESEFDKQVQREMEGLRIRPSAAVWENVEKELRRKKRRRFIIAFWLLAGTALLGYTGYLATQQNTRTAADTSSLTDRADTHNNAVSGKGSGTSHAPDSKTPGVVQSPAANGSVTTIQPAGPDKAGPADKIPTPSLLDSAPSPASDEPVAGAVGIGAVKHPVQIQQAEKNNRSKSPRNKRQSGEMTSELTAKDKNKQKTVMPAEIPPTAPETVNSNEIKRDDQHSEVTGGTADQPAIPVDSAADTTAAKADSAAVKKQEEALPSPVTAPENKRASKKLKWSLDLAFGGSGPVTSPFLLGDNGPDQAMRDMNAAPVQGSGLWTPITPPSSFGPVSSPRSDIRPGIAYRAGVLAELPLSKTVSFISGLQYQYQSNNIRIGSFVNTQMVFSNFASQRVSANGVYQGVQQKTFTNRFHHLQIPLWLNWKLNKSEKLPVILNTGLTAGYLISTNALVYDPMQGGTYYYDRSAFKRFQLSITSGLSFRFGNTKALQWSIGPEVSMGLRKMVRQEYDTKQYPVYIGLQGRLFLPRTKRK